MPRVEVLGTVFSRWWGSAWICRTCGALVVDPDKHDVWHYRVALHTHPVEEA